MIFQVFASAILVAVVLYAVSQARMAPKVTILAVVFCVLGEYLVLFPNQATVIARLFGVGRGADLVFYFWTLISLVVILNLHLKLRSTNERFVTLVRELALMNEAASERAAQDPSRRQ